MILSPGDVVLDYSYGRPDPAAMVAAGVRAVCRYISNQASRKNLTDVERDGLFAAGLGILLVFEEAASSPLQGAVYGVKHGTAAGAMARALGYPESVPLIIAAQDMSLLPAQWGTVADYVKAFRAAAGWPILYAYCGTNIGNWLVGAGLIHGIWKPAAGSWSSDRNDSAVVVEQLFGYVHPGVAGLGSVDDNTVLKPLTVWDGKEGAKTMAYMIQVAGNPEIDVTDGVVRRRLTPSEFGDLSPLLGPVHVVAQATWDGIPVYSPSVSAQGAPVVIPTHITLSGTLS